MYGKIYESTFTGSMAGTGAHVFSVWSYVIANTKPDSMVELNPLLLAAMIGEDIGRIEQAIEFLCNEDVKSRSKNDCGKRLIKKAEFLYFVPNYQKYRGMPNDEARKLYFAEKQRQHRQRLKECQTVKSNESNNVKQAVLLTASASCLEEVREFAKGEGVSESDADWFFYKCEGNGWTNAGKKIRDWKATFRSWHKARYLPSQKQGVNGQRPLLPECLRMSPPRDWQEARRIVRHLESKKSEHPAYAKQIGDKIEALTAQFKL